METHHFNIEAVRQEMQKGRGGDSVSMEPVELEPDFTPFHFRRGIGERNKTRVDCKRSGAVDKIWPMTAIRIRPSVDDKSSQDMAEQFLSSISDRVAFEIVAYKGTIACQIAAGSDVVHLMLAQLSTLYPGASVFQAQDLLGELVSCPMAARAYRLRESHFFPLRTDFKVDTYGPLFGTMLSLRENEIGVFQVILTPIRWEWRQNIRVASRSELDHSKSVFYDLPDLPKLADRKAEKPLLAVSLRLAGSSSAVVDRLEGFLTQFEGDNGFISLREPYPPLSVCRRGIHTSGMLLNITEVSHLVHVPSPPLISWRVEKADRCAPPPQTVIDDITVPLGENNYCGVKTFVGIREEELTRHSIVIGQTGQGKTTLILHQLVALASKKSGFCFVDPGADAAGQLAGLIARDRRDDIVFFNPDDAFPPAFNVLECADDRERQLLCSDLLASFENYYRDAWGPRMAMILRNDINLLLHTPGEKTLLDVLRVITDKQYREELLGKVDDTQVLAFWREIFPNLPKGVADPILNKLSEFADNERIRHIIAQPNLIDISKIMRERKLLIVSLCKGLIGEDVANLLGSFLLAKLRIATMARAAIPIEKRTLFCIVVDEAHNYANTRANASIITSLLSEARKFRVGITLSTQFLSQMHPAAVESALANAHTLAVFRSGLPDAQILHRELGSFEVEDILNLGIGEALVRVGKSQSAFNVRVPPPLVPDKALADDIIRLSESKYCRPREAVEKMVRANSRVTIDSEKSGIDRGFSAVERSFLQYVWSNPEETTTAIYKELGLSTYTGNKLKKSLLKAGMLCEVRTKLGKSGRIAKFLLPSQKACKAMGFPPYHGRGGLVHKYLQSWVGQLAQSRGYQVHVEEQLSDGDGAVDVLLKKDGKTIAVEIAVASTAEREVRNIRKCLDAGYEPVLSLHVDESLMCESKEIIARELPDSDSGKIVLGLVNDVDKFI